MMYSKAKANLLWARVQMHKEENCGPGRGLRYDLADLMWNARPEKNNPGMIPVSVAAKQALANGQKKLRYEHSVPLSVLFQMMCEAETVEQMVKVIEENYQATLVTLEEDKRLNLIGLRARMPEGWIAGDVMARYRVAGIEF